MAKECTEIKLYNGEETILFDDSLDDNGEKRHAYWRLDKENLTKKGEPRKVRVAGVTTFLSIIDKSQFLIPWAVGATVEHLRQNLDKIQEDPNKLLAEAKAESERLKKEAGDLGKDIHRWIELHIKGEKPEIPENENVKRGVISFLEWEAANKIKYVASEKIVYSRRYNYVGTLDIIAKINGGLYLLDLKTGNAIYGEHHLQTAAYLMADMEENSTKYDGRIILRVAKETEEQYQERMKEKKYYQENPEKYPYLPFEAIWLDRGGSKVHQDFEIFKAALIIYNWKKN